MADYDLIVIGAGMAGINATARAVGDGRRIAVIERDRVGGTCPVRGCIPTKALIRSAEIAHEARGAGEFGIGVGEVTVDFAAVMERVRAIIDRGSNGAQGYLESLDGVRLVLGEATLTGPDAVRVNGETLSAPAIILATGKEPGRVDIPGLDAVRVLTSDDVLQLSELPPRLVVIGAGPVGLELGQALSRLGARVTLVEVAERLLPQSDPEIGEALAELLEAEGIEVLVGAEIDRAEPGPEGAARLVLEHGGATRTLEADALLLGVGRVPSLAALDLDAAGVAHTPRGIEVDGRLATSVPGIWAAGDVLPPPWGPLTSVARRLGGEVAENALGLDPHEVSDDLGPWAIFTDPEVASVGLTEAAAREAGHEVSVATSGFSGGKARAWGVEHGVVKVVLEAGTRRILGAHVLAYHASDLVHPVAVAMAAGDGTADPIAASMFIHPTLGEVVKGALASAAG